jgi:hypothetical protein
MEHRCRSEKDRSGFQEYDGGKTAGFYIGSRFPARFFPKSSA